MTNKQQPENSVRIAKFLASAGIASRRRCEELIAEGRVTVNDTPILTPATFVDPENDIVKFEGKIVKPVEDKTYVILNKPGGYTCSAQDDYARRLVFHLLPENLGRLFTIGRLDRDTEGLILLTNDGELAQKLTHPSFQVEKTYVAECEGIFDERASKTLLEGVMDDGEFLKAKRASKLRQTGENTFLLEVVLTEGKKREVRRLCAQAGCPVVRLARTQFATIKLQNLETGAWRHLTQQEIKELKDLENKIATRKPNRYRKDG